MIMIFGFHFFLPECSLVFGFHFLLPEYFSNFKIEFFFFLFTLICDIIDILLHIAIISHLV
jgi:hypothetical protein